jgi:hypothetical protein
MGSRIQVLTPFLGQKQTRFCRMKRARLAFMRRGCLTYLASPSGRFYNRQRVSLQDSDVGIDLKPLLAKSVPHPNHTNLTVAEESSRLIDSNNYRGKNCSQRNIRVESEEN